jgi:uncharacterized protein YcbK (DUF882 family)
MSILIPGDFIPPAGSLVDPVGETLSGQPVLPGSGRLSRRDFLKGALVAGAAAAFLPNLASAASATALSPTQSLMDAQFWARPRWLDLYREANGERLQACYWANGQLSQPGYGQICWLMRDTHVEQWTWIDPRLLDLMCAIQAWVRQYGYTQPLHINSGFRTVRTNDGLEGAARNSMHLHAKAVDFTMPGLPWQYVGQLAARYVAGGVGFYPSSKFIHADTGRLRYWVR